MSLPSPWRADFPAFAAFDTEGITYLDSAATAQKPHAVLEALHRYYAQGAANVHRAQHRPGERATEAFEAARTNVAHWLNAASADNIIFTRGSTESLNLLAYGLEAHFQPGDEIAISALEHHANLLPWQQLAQRQQLKLVVLPLNAAGQIDLAQATQLIGARTRLLAISQLSNVLGCWQPLPELLSLARQHGAFTVVDGAQGAVHQQPDMQQLGCDFYVFSGHKLYAPDGIGVLYGRTTALAQLQHWQFGGEMLHHTDYQHAEFRAAPLGFEAGTPAIAAAIGLGAALDYLQRHPQQARHAHEIALHQYLLQELTAIDGLHILGKPEAALACFQVDGVHSADLSHLLAEQGMAVRTGQHCAMPLFQHLGLSGAVRVSLGFYNTSDDIARFIVALKNALELLR